MDAAKYRLKNDVTIDIRNHKKVTQANFTDADAEIIFNNPRLDHDYGHNIEVLDPKALKALKKRMESQQIANRPPEDIVIEVDLGGTKEAEKLPVKKVVKKVVKKNTSKKRGPKRKKR